MKQRKSYPRLICCTSIVVIFLSACSHSKLKPTAHLSGKKQLSSMPPASTPPKKTFHVWTNSKDRLSQSDRTKTGQLTRTSWKERSPNYKKNHRPVSYDNLWERLFGMYDLPPIEHGDIDRELEWFVNHPDYVDRVQTRAEPYLYSIVEQLEKHELPGEIALLPVIESAFQPHALSSAKAAGIWQFIPSTGRLYGLKQSRWYDGRRDIYASTEAAIRYLKKLHAEFNGDWLLALAAYNAGEGAVERAIEKNLFRNQPTDFWSLDLPEETRCYVPRLLAVAKLFAESNLYGIDLHRIPNQAVFEPIEIDSPLDLALAADMADIPLQQLYALNPGFKHSTTDPEGPHRLLIPVEKSESFKRELTRLASEGRGATRSRLASRLENINIADVRDAGDDITVIQPSKLMLNNNTFIQTRKQSTEPSFTRTSAIASTQDRLQNDAMEPRARRLAESRLPKSPFTSRGSERTDVSKGTHTVRAGETLFGIAREHSIAVEQLAKWNGVSKQASVKTGEKLILWNREAAKKLSLAKTGAGFKPSQSIKYTVREGDSIFGISRRFRVSITDLKRWNGIKSDKQLQAGQNLKVTDGRD